MQYYRSTFTYSTYHIRKKNADSARQCRYGQKLRQLILMAMAISNNCNYVLGKPNRSVKVSYVTFDVDVFEYSWNFAADGEMLVFVKIGHEDFTRGVFWVV